MVEWVKVLLELPDPVNVVDVFVDTVVVVVVDRGVTSIVVVVGVVALSPGFDVLNRPAEPDSHRL